MSANNKVDPTRFYYPDTSLFPKAFQGELVNGTFQSQLSVGSMLFPEKPCDSISWQYSQLLQCLDLLDTNLKTMSIDGISFRRYSFVIAFLLAKVNGGPGSWASGLNLQSGSQLRLQLTGMPAGNPITGIHTVLCGDTVVEIAEKGVSWYT